jgi:hypothetical protein
MLVEHGETDLQYMIHFYTAQSITVHVQYFVEYNM